MENPQSQFTLSAYSGAVSINSNNILVFGGSNKSKELTDSTFLCNTANNYIQVVAWNTVILIFTSIDRFLYRLNVLFSLIHRFTKKPFIAGFRTLKRRMLSSNSKIASGRRYIDF
jgi:type IV secretory pathway TrbL component